MTTDNYAPCPCGSGKKMKFCKCVDQPQEYEKLVRLIEGGQELAAMERVNQLLAKSPSAAWLLAIKGEVALSMREYDTFKETANRFIKLKPDNPLALIMSSLVTLGEGEPIETGVRQLLEGLAESREALPSLTLDALQILCTRLKSSTLAPFRFFWVQLLDRIGKESQMADGPFDRDGMLYDNLLTMAPVSVPAITASAPWSERAREVDSLASTFRYAQAENKLRNILRDFPDQLWPTVKLLEVQMALLDQPGAFSSARKLSTHRDLDETSRDYYTALSFELEPDRLSLSLRPLSRFVEVESDDEALAAITALDFAMPLAPEPSQFATGYFGRSIGDEVPAKQIFLITDTFEFQGKKYTANCGNVVLFGRQTDKPSRALVLINPLSDGQAMFDKIVSALQPKADLEDPSAPRWIHYLDVITRPYFAKQENDQLEPATPEVTAELVANDFVSMKFPALDNLTPLEAAEQEPKRAALRGLLTHLDGMYKNLIPAAAIEKIYERVQLTRPSIDPTTIDRGRPMSMLDLVRCDLSKASDKQLGELLVTGLTLNIPRLTGPCSTAILARPATEELNQFRYPALQIASNETHDPEQALAYLEELEGLQVTYGQGVGEAILRRVDLLRQLGREEESQSLLITSIRKYPGDPTLLRVMEYINQQSRRMSPGMLDEDQMLNRMVTRRADVDDDGGSGLVLPGESSAPEGGKSKLWLPGS